MQPISTYIDSYDKNKFIKEYDNYIHAHGGDGTLIRAVSMHRDKNKPFFGSAAGTENFMMNPEKEILDTSTTIEVNNIHVEVTFTEDAEIKTESYEAFNELALGGDMNSWISYSFDNELYEEVKGSGMIFSTTQGSTSFNKNNGGKVLPLSSKEWSITGLATNRRINSVIDPTETTIYVKSRTPVTAWIDGSNNKVVKNVISVKISKGTKVQLIFNDIEAFKKKRR